MSLEQLLAERDIYRKLVAFARAMDERDWPALAAITTPDFSAELGMGEIQGQGEVIAFIRSFLDPCGPSQHLLGNVLIDIDGDRAHSEAYVAQAWPFSASWGAKLVPLTLMRSPRLVPLTRAMVDRLAGSRMSQGAKAP